MARYAIMTAACLMILAAPLSGAIIDHSRVDGVASLPMDVMNAIGEQKWLFTHASVGSNMMSGMAALQASDPARYQLGRAGVSYNSSLLRAYNPPATTVDGTIYDCSRGNPGWPNKFTIFANSVNVAGWNAPAVDVVMDKLCYIDQNASAASYLSMMASLEAAHPDTIFVYATMPLMVASSSNTLRNLYNIAVRDYSLANDRLLFDIADIEAHDAAGNEYTYTDGGTTYQRMYSGWSTDGGHLNAAGQLQVARGWYATAAEIAMMAETCDLHRFGDADCDGEVGISDFVILKNSFGMGIPWPDLRADFNGDGEVGIPDFVILKNNFGATAVPEPATAALLTAGALAIVRRRR